MLFRFRTSRVISLRFVFAMGLVALTWSQPAFSGTFPGQNGKIAYISNRDSVSDPFVISIYVINPDGTGETRLTSGNADQQPCWSPNGAKIAFSRRAIVDGEPSDLAQIFVMNADGTNATNVSNSGIFDAEPSWSPDGTKIAFSRQPVVPGSTRHIWVMNADGTGQTQLTANGTGFNSHPSWSPDGTKIAFTRGVNTPREIYVMNVDGTNVVNLTNNGGFNAGPSWSPDGTRIAFQKRIVAGGGSLEGSSQIWAMDADGSDQIPLTTLLDDVRDFRPSWSPEGDKIAFHSYRASDGGAEGDPFDARRRLWVMDYDGSNLTLLTPNNPENQEPNWGPLTPSDLAGDLDDAVSDLPIEPGTKNSLRSKLARVAAAIQAGNVAEACGALRAFINEVNAQAGKKITSADAAELIEAANELRTLIGCS